jgi:hypothetical protein
VCTSGGKREEKGFFERRKEVMKKRLWKIVLVVLLCCVGLTRATVVDITVATDKLVYQLGEYVIVSVTAYNPNPQPVTLNFSSTQATYLMDDTFDWTYGKPFLLWNTQRTINPYESYTWIRPHGAEEMAFYPLGIGIHTVVGQIWAGELGENNTTLPVQFEVIPEPATLVLLAVGLPVFRVFARRKI